MWALVGRRALRGALEGLRLRILTSSQVRLALLGCWRPRAQGWGQAGWGNMHVLSLRRSDSPWRRRRRPPKSSLGQQMAKRVSGAWQGLWGLGRPAEDPESNQGAH